MIGSKPIYRVEYFADADARKRWERTEEKFVDDFSGAEHRATELGRTYPWAKFVAVGWADTDTRIASYGTDVRHDIAPLRTDRRGKFHCRCGRFPRDQAAVLIALFIDYRARRRDS